MKPRSPAAWLLLVLVGVAYLLHLGDPPLWDANEPLYAQPPAEALTWEGSDGLTPTWNGRPYFAHAPLSTWITIPFYAVLGVNEAAGRLPMALAALLTLWGTACLVRRLGCSSRTALLAALVLAATPRYWLFARQLAGDVYLTAAVTWAWALAVRAFDPRRADRLRRRDISWAAVAVGLGVLAKGPVAIVLAVGPLLVAWGVAGRPVTLRSLGWGRSTLILLAIALPWSVLMALRHPDFLGLHYGWYHGARLIGGIGRRGLLFYPLALAGEALPWWLLCPWGQRRTRARPPYARFVRHLPWIGIAFIVLFFTLPAGKRNVYLLPAYPLLAAMAAMALVRLGRLRGRPQALLALGLVATAAVGAGLMARWTVTAPGLAPEGVVLAVALALGGVLSALVVLRHPRHAVPMVVGGLLLLQVGVAAAFPALGRYKPMPRVAERIRAQQDEAAPEPAILYAVPLNSLNFYLGRATEVAHTPADLVARLDPQRGGFVVTAAMFLDPLPPGAPPPRRTVGRHLSMLEPTWAFEELLRAPEIYFHFGGSILGRGRTTRDLVVLRLRPR